ncbi:MAG: YqaJ viral recombinase family protein [Chloroflexota bacterium]|nr:YqaJ viral recombinase family protein [Chloroflexota bacterium]
MSLSPQSIAVRATGIGASEAPMVLGESPHGGPVALYMRKLGLETVMSTDAQMMGNILEDGMAKFYEQTRGVKVRAYKRTLRHPKHHCVLATPDRRVVGRRRLVQIKIVGQWMAHHWRDDEDGIPDYTRIQVQQEMAVTGIEWCDVAALICGTEPRIYQVAFDPELADLIIAADIAFWRDHVEPRIPPEPDGTEKYSDLLAALYPRDRTPMIEATPELDAIAKKLARARSESKRWATEKELREQEMKVLLGETEGARGVDWTVTWKANAKGARSFLFKTDSDRALVRGKAA